MEVRTHRSTPLHCKSSHRIEPKEADGPNQQVSLDVKIYAHKSHLLIGCSQYLFM